MNYPSSIKHREKLDALTGIKSSLNQLRSVISLAYLIYVANGRKSEADYSISDGSIIKLNPNLQDTICQYLGKHDIDELINNNPLIKCQFEPLYVGITLLLKLGSITMRGKSSTTERTGGKRYPKQLLFANNMVILDLIVEGFPETVRKQSLAEWLENKSATDTDFENRLRCFITTCTTFTQFKLRNNVGDEVFFQTEGIYEQAVLNESGVAFEDSHEFVGPSRIYNNILKENLEPWLSINGGIVTISDADGIDCKSMKEILSNTLDIYSVSDDSVSVISETEQDDDSICQSLQQIFYGAPGTGKSNIIKRKVDDKGLPNERITFHPDSDYSTFVGSYKPKVIDVPVLSIIGEKAVETGRTEKKIVYEFVPQAFLKAYTEAWKNLDKPFFLIIEEINRGNCAQIFGDLFQLLDRKDGESEYPISPDENIQTFLQTDKKLGFAGLTEEQKAGIPTEILSGELMRLPKNLHIWATMNTSDQSLFPIDSAFKRRWEWKYVRICEGKGNDGNPLDYRIKFTIPAKDEQPEEQVDVKWWDFVKAINRQIEDATKSEDKKLGFFFCKPDKKEDGEEENTIISAETFVGKVVFYLWQDVFKDYGFKSNIFKRENGQKISFHDFYPEDVVADKDTNPEGIDLALVKAFIQKVLDSNKENPS